MTNRLDEQLRRYGEYFDSLLSDAEAEAVTDAMAKGRVRLARPSAPSRWWTQGWVLAAAVAAMVLLVIGGTMLLLRPFGDAASIPGDVTETTAAPVTTPPTTFPSSTTEPSPPVTAPLMAPLTWEEVPMADALQGGLMSAVTEFDSGYIAVGGVRNSTGRSDPAVWISDNGREWRRIQSNAFDTGPRPMASDDLYIADVAVGPLGIIAVGGEGRVGSLDYDAAIWVSPAGADWERVVIDPVVLGGPGSQVMRRVVAGGPGWVAIGEADDIQFASRLLVSRDGLTWERIPDEQVTPDGAPVRITDLAAGDGLIVAVGHSPVSNATGAYGGDPWPPYTNMSFEGFRPLVWVSSDGYQWEQISLTPGDATGDVGGGILESVTVTGDGSLVAVGKALNAYPAVWRSIDGRRWFFVPSTFEEIYDLGLRGETGWWPPEPFLPRIVAVGSDLFVAGDCAIGGCVYGSTDDGATWAQVATYDWRGPEADLAPQQPMTGLGPAVQWAQCFADVVGFEDRILVVGSKALTWNDTDQFAAAVWLGSRE